MAQHAFEPADFEPKTCGYTPTDGRPICGFPASNRAIHAPGALPGPRLHSVPVIRQDSASVAIDAPETSIAAAAVTLPHRGSLRFEIVQLLNHPGARGRGLTDDEIEQVTGQKHTSVSSARNSLMNDGIVGPLVEDGEKVTRPTKASGSKATAWILTEQGLAAYAAECTEVAS